jgi:hypothetical protein
MPKRWVGSLVAVAVAVGISISLPGAGVARADPVQTVVDTGGTEAAARGTTAGVAMLDRVTGRYADNGPNAQLRFGSASLVKLFIADSLLYRAGLGQIGLSQADRNALGIMLRSSDDPAASSLWSRFGGSSIVSDVVHRYRLGGTTPPVNPRYWGLTQVTARDMVAFYDGVLSGAGGLSAADRDFIVGQLRQATVHGTDGVHQWFGLRDGLPREPVIGIKQGWMCCFSDGYIWRHSTGIVGPDARYVVVVLARDQGSMGSAHTVTSATATVQRMFPAGLVPRVQGLIGDRWYGIGGHRSVLGLPTSGEMPLRGGAMNWFERGAIYWSPRTDAHPVIGSILEAYRAHGYERGRLGYPTTGEIALRGGAVSGFQGGYVYWSPRTGAHAVGGAILGAYGAHGQERGPLGYPTSNEIALTGGAVNRFQGGSVYWSPRTGAHPVIGALLAAYGARGYERGALGYPTSDPHPVAGGTRVDFERGSLTLRPDGEVVLGGVPAAARSTVPQDAGAPSTPSGATEAAPDSPPAAPALGASPGTAPVPSATGEDGTP